MGCDIHLFAEAKCKKTLLQKLLFWRPKRWVTLDHWILDNDYEPPRITVPYGKRFYNGGRCYNLFTALCGVRSGIFNGEPRMISEPRGIPKDTCAEILQEVANWDGEGHSHNYNTLKELKEFDWSDYGNTCDSFRNEVIPKMEALKVPDTDVRIVYFFDN